MILKTLAFTLVSLAACASVRAVTVYDNLTVNPYYGASDGDVAGQSFVTGGTALSLSNVVFLQETGTDAHDDFTTGETFSLYSNSTATDPNGTPGTLLSLALTLSNVSDTTSASYGQTTATFVGGYTLAANTRYWLVLGTPGNALPVSWSFADYDPTIPSYYKFNSALGVTIPDANTSFDGDGYYNLTSGSSPGANMLIINAVPEPSTYFLMGVAGLALVVSRKRSRKLA